MTPNDIKRLQSRVGVAEDGLWGPRTRTALFAALGIEDVPVASPAASPGHLEPSQACIALIQEFEGYGKKLPGDMVQAYPDPGTGGDPWTIGWGTTGPDVKKGTVWPQAKAEQRFRAHVEEFAGHVRRMIGSAPTTQGQFDALVSLCYNVGPANLKSSTLVRMHNAGDYAGAAAQFARWNRAAGKVMAGLTRRRAAEAELYRKPA